MSRVRLAGAVLCGALVACLFYSADRSWAAWHEAPLQALVATGRVDYFWRAGLAAFLGSLAGLAWLGATRGREVAALALTARLAPVVVGACALASVLWP